MPVRPLATARLATPSRVFNCSYHSYHHPPPPPASPYNPTQALILEASLQHVPEHGFTTTSLAHGARDVGYRDISINLFSRNSFDLVNYHLVSQRERLAKNQAIDFAALEQANGGKRIGMNARIRMLCVERLRGNVPIIHRWQEALAIMSLGRNIPVSLAELTKLADEIWYLAGDTSADTSWYTKRATLSALYSSTELFMSQDKSEDFAETWNFLDRRLSDVRTLGQTTSNISEYVGYTLRTTGNILRSKNLRLFG